jgi:hypothetical protein
MNRFTLAFAALRGASPQIKALPTYLVEGRRALHAERQQITQRLKALDIERADAKSEFEACRRRFDTLDKSRRIAGVELAQNDEKFKLLKHLESRFKEAVQSRAL